MFLADAVTQLAYDPGITPSDGGLPGLSVLKQVMGSLNLFGIIAAVGALAASAGVWAWGNHTGGHQAEANGKKGVMVSSRRGSPAGRCERRGRVLQRAGNAGPLMPDRSLNPGGASRVRRRALLGAAVLMALVVLRRPGRLPHPRGQGDLRRPCGAPEFDAFVVSVRIRVRVARFGSRPACSRGPAEHPQSDRVREGGSSSAVVLRHPRVLPGRAAHGPARMADDRAQVRRPRVG